jgi:hypothetical protein
VGYSDWFQIESLGYVFVLFAKMYNLLEVAFVFVLFQCGLSSFKITQEIHNSQMKLLHN